MERPAGEYGVQPGVGNDALVAIERGKEQPAADDNPWVRTAGMFADEPFLMILLAEIYAARDAQREAEDLAE